MNEEQKAAERDRIMDIMDVRDGSIEMPVELGLLEDVPTAGATEAYDLPDPEVLAELAQAQEVERQVAEKVATVRDEQSLAIANMGRNGVHHFLVNVQGAELCGSCGTAFPCASWTEEIGPRNTAESSGQPVPDEDKARALAELLGVDLEHARQIVLLSTPLDELRRRP